MTKMAHAQNTDETGMPREAPPARCEPMNFKSYMPSQAMVDGSEAVRTPSDLTRGVAADKATPDKATPDKATPRKEMKH
jgi:hypothetical protein